MGALRKLTLRHWVWIHFKVAMLAWVTALMIYTPTKIHNALGLGVVLLFVAVTALGAVTSMVGIVMSAQSGTRTGVIGISVELAGLYFMSAGPAAYLLTQVWLVFTATDGNQRIALCFQAYLICAALLCRIVIVAPRRNREAHDSTKDV